MGRQPRIQIDLVSYSTSFRPTDGHFGKLTDSRLDVLLLVAETEVHQQPQQAGQQDGHCGELKDSRLMRSEDRPESSYSPELGDSCRLC